MYFHHQPNEHILMAGLEQSAPLASIREAIWRPDNIGSENDQKHHDQFGQAHSLVGAAGTFTAAGSLYFSDPLYKAKLLVETNSMPPQKFGGMHVSLNNENWQEVKRYLEQLNENLILGNDDGVFTQLLQRPSTARERVCEIESYIALDFKTYIKRIEILLHNSPIDWVKHNHETHELLILIEKLQSADYSVLKEFKEAIQSLQVDKTLPKTYKRAIWRIHTLFERQINRDLSLEQAYKQILCQPKADKMTQDLSINEKERRLRIETLDPALKFIESLEQEFLALDNTKYKRAAHLLIKLLKQECINYIDGKLDLPSFQIKCNDYVAQAKESFIGNDYWKVLLGNLLVCISSLVVPYVVAGLANLAMTGNFLFFKSDSPILRKCELFEKNFNHLAEDATLSVAKA